jgi:MFS family permease
MELRHKQRVFLSYYFFLSGVCFSSWASRIPTIKTAFGYNEAELGTILLFMPISSLIGLPISGWLVSKYDSRIPLVFAFILLSVALCGIGLADTTTMLIVSISLFSFSTRILNISVNTQAITLQKKFDKRINGSFHGLWSTGGIVGVGFSTMLVALDVSISTHLLIIAAFNLVTTLICYPHLIKNDRAPSGNKLQLGKPDPYIVYLGLVVFLTAICEGGMFDWSGVYFKEVVQVEVFTWGYLMFMICMAISRFASDFVIERIALATIFPFFWTSALGFCFVGLGTASVIPMVYSLAGNSKKYSPGMAISIIATYSIVGMLIGPPLIGYIAHAFNLRVSFITFAITAIMIIPITQFFFTYQRKQNEAPA